MNDVIIVREVGLIWDADEARWQLAMHRWENVADLTREQVLALP